ncbi:MAG: GntR family transcriptional regulator [Clostridia bacterium]|nr:GntR family transcriptional regulator [Clostridia bacterium]
MEFREDKAIFVQIAESIEDDILRGILFEDERAPSTNELAAAYEINPNTAAKSLSMLMNDGILYKKRGVGMFVAAGAKEKIFDKRRCVFVDDYLHPMLREAKLLGLTPDMLASMIREEAGHEEVCHE